MKSTKLFDLRIMEIDVEMANANDDKKSQLLMEKRRLLKLKDKKDKENQK